MYSYRCQLVSLHGDPKRAYPWFIGHEDEVGAGKGRGYNINVAFGPEAEDDEYVSRLAGVCEEIAAFGPSMVIVSLGVDTYWNDPISDLALTTDGYRRCVRAGWGSLVRIPLGSCARRRPVR